MFSTSTVSSGVAGRYAAALFDLAEEKKCLDEIAADTDVIRALLAESDDLRRLVSSPVIGREPQGRALAAVLAKAGTSELTRKFVGVVAKNRRLFALNDMCVAYYSLLALRRGQMTAEVVSAQPLSDTSQAALEKEIRKAMGSKVQVNVSVDPSLLGGMIVKVGSRMVDSSLKSKLQKLELSLKGAA